ncbi:MAG: hypothetical protein EHM17_00220 [Verrucomicrobiaceae bacterium]|jgi:hypothetical protein|nr:MAG: hypothetical protein EHM17_16855 [Verrucomicrobiaceae bacterium]RPJ31810.1 MAG: hypothetical protein EHM17_15035 [Verrucomicrobiaceae bacterium]RPJ33055.1 MAG: hypothetical protein EHM17_11585 [Verrucomicrobiaceae bacterium]RPJ36045.1 MAG: hypothetical protein EHM17_00220 [Verrucomicrobiaceae bacterium]
MTDQAFTALMLSLVGTFFGLLVAVLGWMGNKIYLKLEEVNLNLGKLDRDLTTKVHEIDKRVTRLESIPILTRVAKQ